jgi:hypothetical protein
LLFSWFELLRFCFSWPSGQSLLAGGGVPVGGATTVPRLGGSWAWVEETTTSAKAPIINSSVVRMRFMTGSNYDYPMMRARIFFAVMKLFCHLDFGAENRCALTLSAW